jgi:EAL domain-containing protein (putative c-di-GMP-specific phosphodiesterase class I)
LRSKYHNVFILIAAILAFAPVAAVDYLLDSYVRIRETGLMQRSVDNIGVKIEAEVEDAIGSIDSVLADSPSLCTPTFVANVHKAMRTSLHVKDMLVENTAGVQYCDGFGEPFDYAPQSDVLSIPGHSETLSVVKLDGLAMPVLKVTQPYGAERQISAFVPVLSNAADTLLTGTRSATMVRVSLTNGTPIITLGDVDSYDHRHADHDFIAAQSFAGEIPLRAEAAVPFGMVRADYANLDVSFTLIACAMCAAFLVLMLQYVRRSNLPAFDLERAIVLGELKPYYQPVIDLRTGRLEGCEMLCRWEKRNGTIVPPGAFIDYAEATGLAIPMTVSLMQQVRADLADLCRDMPDIKVSINLFEGHFRDDSIIHDVQAIFGGSPIELSQLVFEITERRPLGNSTQAHAVIAGLHALGARLAMDDAGTGHSNLAYLQTLGVDVIKIDRVFVDMIKPDTKQVPVLDGLIAVARDLGTEVVAEGVETEAQARYLRAHGVFMAQGYLFAPALKAKLFIELARALNTPRPAVPEALPSAA